VVSYATAVNSPKSVGSLVVAIRRTSFFLVNPVLDQVSDRDHLEAVRGGERGQLRDARHPAVLVQNFADHARG